MKGAALALLVAACGPVQTSIEWLEFGAVPLDAEGKTAELRVPWQADAKGILIEVRSGSGRCFQVDPLTDEAGHTYVGPGEWGPYCSGCEQRSAVAAGGGLFSFPSRPGPFAPSGALQFRLGLRDCNTLTREVPAASQTLSVRARRLAQAPKQGTLALRLVVTSASVFYATKALEPVLTALNAELASAHVTARFVEVTRLGSEVGSGADFSRADPAQLQRLLAHAPQVPGIAVVLAGCLQLSDPVFGSRSEVQGYTPRIPGGVGPADGVFIAGALCGTPKPVSIAWSATGLGRVMAHELGHYLGLFHSVESDGTEDQLEDTGAANLMFNHPDTSSATGFSLSQGALMRAHPAVQPDL